MTGGHVRRFLLSVVGCIVGVIAAAWLATTILNPGPPSRIVIATGGAGGAYHNLAETWKRELARFGVTLALRPDLEGANTLGALLAPDGGVDAGFVKGGVVGSLQGRLAQGVDQIVHDWHFERLQSVGRLFYEPLWVFYRGPKLLKSLGEFKGRRIIVGTATSGTRRVVTLLLKANGVTAENSTFIEQDFPADAKPLIGDGADVAFLSLPPDDKKVQDLLRTPGIYLMDFSAEMEAYVTRFPFLSKVAMPRGAVEFDPDIPSADIALLATAPALVVRRELHPALAVLLTHASWVNAKPGFDKSGEPILFYRAGQFPNADDPEYEVHADAKTYYKAGELPVLLRASTVIPLWATAFGYLHATKILLIAIPILSIMIPLSRYLPAIYSWMVRRRLMRWYDKLKALEFTLDDNPTQAQLAQLCEELRRIDRAVSRLRLPRDFSDQLYHLRGHIDLVEQRLSPERVGTRTGAL